MRHYTSTDFWELFRELPNEIQDVAIKKFELLKDNPHHSSLRLKRIDDLWSVRIGKYYRSVGINATGGIQWIWIGNHVDYNKYIAQR